MKEGKREKSERTIGKALRSQRLRLELKTLNKYVFGDLCGAVVAEETPPLGLLPFRLVTMTVEVLRSKTPLELTLDPETLCDASAFYKPPFQKH